MVEKHVQPPRREVRPLLVEPSVVDDDLQRRYDAEEDVRPENNLLGPRLELCIEVIDEEEEGVGPDPLDESHGVDPQVARVVGLVMTVVVLLRPVVRRKHQHDPGEDDGGHCEDYICSNVEVVAPADVWEPVGAVVLPDGVGAKNVCAAVLQAEVAEELEKDGGDVLGRLRVERDTDVGIAEPRRERRLGEDLRVGGVRDDEAGDEGITQGSYSNARLRFSSG